ncbi:MAG: efflux RND transporter periplasmic adaptor subunit [Hyphomicrobiales bacterium]|nr:efflux RND transporter periplasmic adaptor subunit [Hyphomicrobiales bacterium]
MMNFKKVNLLISLSVLALFEISAWGHAATPQAQAEAPVHGLVRAVAQATVTSGINLRIATLPFKTGESFTKGAALVTFDCSQLQAERAAAMATARAMHITYASNLSLARLHAAGRNDVAIAKANADKADAKVDAWNAQMRDCTIKAPFDGTIASEPMHAFETPAANQPIMTIVDSKRLEVEVIVPAKWLTFLKDGTPFKISPAATGGSYDATVSRISAVVDPVSQTVKVFGALTGDTGPIRPGMSVAATFEHGTN